MRSCDDLNGRARTLADRTGLSGAIRKIIVFPASERTNDWRRGTSGMNCYDCWPIQWESAGIFHASEE